MGIDANKIMIVDDSYENIPDARDGLNKKERVILYCLKAAQDEFLGKGVPTATLYGRVVEHIDMDQREFQEILNRLVGLTRNSDGSMSYG